MLLDLSSAAAFCLHPFPQSLPVETLGQESTVDTESERAPQALGSPSKAAVEELAGAEAGGGNRAPLGAGPRFLRERGFGSSYFLG